MSSAGRGLALTQRIMPASSQASSGVVKDNITIPLSKIGESLYVPIYLLLCLFIHS
jgi:hypothetical protein